MTLDWILVAIGFSLLGGCVELQIRSHRGRRIDRLDRPWQAGLLIFTGMVTFIIGFLDLTRNYLGAWGILLLIAFAAVFMIPVSIHNRRVD